MPAAWLIRGTILLATICWAGAEVLRLRQPSRDGLARALWVAGALLALVHTAAAFHFVHGWSHARALADTARQTAALVGRDWGGGLYVNYAFLALWSVDAAWWLIRPRSHRARSTRARDAMQAFFVFMFLNGAVIFGRGPARVLGAAAIAVVVVTWYRARFVTGSSPASRPK
jgi:hypothetical protein